MSDSKVVSSIGSVEKQAEIVTFSGFYRCNHENDNLKIQELIASTDDWLWSIPGIDNFDNLSTIKNKCHDAIFMHTNLYFSHNADPSNCVGPTDMSDWAPMYRYCVIASSESFADYIISHDLHLKF